MGFSMPHLLVVLAIALLLFGTKRLKNLGEDLGSAINGFRKAVLEGDKSQTPANKDEDPESPC
ncbi:MAG: twin-arginine translocase TatA/TatE family subunit [Methylomonas sp.]|jgi:sec-independent protein translocase protein TatA|uniref:twin-arginine translocase TatA/TatE family subunit n=1 Tax=Methylomonas sp. TaxID=418 RepID=UPI0025FDC7E5|nr:twin-arginine translocase TatA/TatE family subunit [Methylomonas sp.]MCK9605049.1 twin-arginine translocase TatA/TatE family subunit [Methylomonas sp.]